jgi:hypothetical protein
MRQKKRRVSAAFFRQANVPYFEIERRNMRSIFSLVSLQQVWLA